MACVLQGDVEMAEAFIASDSYCSNKVCSRVQRWLEEQHAAAQDVFFCDKEALDAEMKAAMAAADKKERKAITKAFDARRKELEALAEAVGEEALPAMGQSLMSLFKDMQPALPPSCIKQTNARDATRRTKLDTRRGVRYAARSQASWTDVRRVERSCPSCQLTATASPRGG